MLPSQLCWPHEQVQAGVPEPGSLSPWTQPGHLPGTPNSVLPAFLLASQGCCQGWCEAVGAGPESAGAQCALGTPGELTCHLGGLYGSRGLITAIWLSCAGTGKVRGYPHPLPPCGAIAAFIGLSVSGGNRTQSLFIETILTDHRMSCFPIYRQCVPCDLSPGSGFGRTLFSG